jgi:hypothetical protein
VTLSSDSAALIFYVASNHVTRQSHGPLNLICLALDAPGVAPMFKGESYAACHLRIGDTDG